MNDTTFERLLLKDAVKEARSLGAIIKNGSIHKTGNTWEFFYKDFSWYGRAENAYHARAIGWEEWCLFENGKNKK